MSEPPLELPTPEAIPDPWAPVDDLDAGDVATPDQAPEEVRTPEDPFAPVGDLDLADDTLVDPLTEEVSPDPWSDAPDDPASEIALGSPPPRLLPEWTAPRQLPPPAPPSTPAPLPWRGAAELLAPLSGRLLCEADPRLERSRLLVSTWEWLDDEEHLRFRLSDDGESAVVRAARTDEAAIAVTLRVQDQELEVELLLAADRGERGVVLGRDALSGRFLVDSARDEWS